MLLRCFFVSTFLFSTWQWVEAEAGLTLNGVRCGVRNCSFGEYCSNFTHSCQSCSKICDPSHHEYDEKGCLLSCQDYIHDLRYVRKDGAGSNDSLRAQVQKLNFLVTVCLTLICCLIIILGTLLCLQIYRWKIKKNVTLATLKSKIFKRNETQETKPPNKQPKPDLRLDISNSHTNVSDRSPITATTSISRRPAEDSALDYAYDNHAMSASPGPKNPDNTF